MKKLYLIRTFNILFPDQHGFIMAEPDKNLKQIKLWETEDLAQRWIVQNQENLRIGWAHVVMPTYVKDMPGQKPEE